MDMDLQEVIVLVDEVSMTLYYQAGLRTRSIFNRVQEIFASRVQVRVLRILFFEFGKNDRVRVHSPVQNIP